MHNTLGFLFGLPRARDSDWILNRVVLCHVVLDSLLLLLLLLRDLLSLASWSLSSGARGVQVRARAEELRRSIDQIIVALQFHADRVNW